ncbi:MAG: amidohydrolase family protein [Novosphingobium sp.]|nr:amidohydrolase family protein [Novosphingobium sp.]
MHDLVIRGGTVVDGTGAAPFVADIAIDGETITKVGTVAEQGREEIDASGRLVTPGFVDLHTHYDAQAMWDPVLAPTAWHGVTSVVMGNCSVGFAPLRRNDRAFPLRVMEAIEEIPVDVMEEGIDWDWESFPEFLDSLERRKHTLDIAAQVTHVALRAYVMGARAEANEHADEADMAEIERLTEEALRAGAIGVSASRTTFHRFPGAGIVPGTFGNEHELLGLADALGRVGGGHVMQYLGNPTDLDHDLPFTRELARHAQSPVHFIISDTEWQRRLAYAQALRDDESLEVYAHVSPRGVGQLGHWRAVEHPFSKAPAMKAISDLPWAERLARLRDPELKSAAIAQTKEAPDAFFRGFAFDQMFELDETFDYEPDPATQSVAARAAASGQDPYALVWDIMTAKDGAGIIWVPITNYKAGDLSTVRQLLEHPMTLTSLSDGGAHSTRVCDSAAPTFMLAHWCRDRTRGETLPVEQVVRWISRDTAFAYGMKDRGVLAPGYLADLNVIDFERLRLHKPFLADDFPGGALRLLQRADGYDATIKRGQVTFRHGEHCGIYPGGVVRGPQAARVPAEAAIR